MFNIESLGGLFEGSDEFLVGFDAGGECVVFGDGFALFFNCGDGDLDFAHFFPVKDFAGATVRMESGVAVKFRATEPHHQIFGIQARINNFKNGISLRNDGVVISVQQGD